MSNTSVNFLIDWLLLIDIWHMEMTEVFLSMKSWKKLSTVQNIREINVFLLES